MNFAFRVGASVALVGTVVACGSAPGDSTAPTKSTRSKVVVPPPPPPPPPKVLIHADTVVGRPSREESIARSLGADVVVKTAVEWSALTTDDFGEYDAIVLGDASCKTAPPAVGSAWGPAVTGNVFIVGSDPVYHATRGGDSVTRAGIAYALDSDGTGAYISTSCYGAGTGSGAMLSPLGAFTTGKQVGCPNRAHKVNDAPAFAAMTDATLSNWGCSVHEVFPTYPTTFQAVAVSIDMGNKAYILARGDLEPVDPDPGP